MNTCTDMTGRVVEVVERPQRIVSLVPSQTELLYDLGLRDEVVGITKFCIHPNEWFRSKKRIGGTKTVHIDQISALQPDLILANKEENTRDQVEELARHFPVWISDITTADEALQMIAAVGDLTGKNDAAGAIVAEIKEGFGGLRVTAVQRRVAYFIWRNPWMCAGGDTFISDMISKMGWVNALGHRQRYPAIELDELTKLDLDLVLLSSEPYPFKDAHISEIRAILPTAEIQLVDGEMFSWYGSRMLEAIPYLTEMAQRSSPKT